jgi:hypothetical protein
MPGPVREGIYERARAQLDEAESNGTVAAKLEAWYGDYLRWKPGDEHPAIARDRRRLAIVTARLAELTAERDAKLAELDELKKAATEKWNAAWRADTRDHDGWLVYDRALRDVKDERRRVEYEWKYGEGAELEKEVDWLTPRHFDHGLDQRQSEPSVW